MTKANPLKNKYDVTSEVARIGFLRQYLISEGLDAEGVYGLTLEEMDMAYRLLNTKNVAA